MSFWLRIPKYQAAKWLLFLAQKRSFAILPKADIDLYGLRAFYVMVYCVSSCNQHNIL
jgi:hypothetical protein